MDDSDSPEKHAIRRRLLEELEALTGRLRDMEESAQKVRKAEGTRPGFGKRIGDYTSEAQDAMNDRAVVANLRTGIAQTQRALQKLEEGTYGLCDQCHQPIPPERLEVLPSATLCVACKSKQERRWR